MFRLWGKEFKDNRMLCDTVICDETDDTRTHKIFHALDKICYEFDLSKPIWLDSTIAEFKRHAKARFYQDNFVDEIDFDYLEIQITTQQMIQAVGSQKPPQAFTSLHGNVSGFSKRICTGRRWNDGISAVETDSRSGRRSAEHKRILPLSFLGTDGIIIS